MNFFEEKIMIIRKQMTDSSLNLHIPSKLSCPESAQLCQDLESRETLECFSTISLDTMMKIIMASKPSSCILDPVPTERAASCAWPSYVEHNKRLPIHRMCTKLTKSVSNKASLEKAQP